MDQLEPTTKNFPTDLVELVSPFDFETTLEKSAQAIAKAGLTLFAQIDHAQAALEAGLQLPPTVVLIYGGPKGGTPVMLAHPQAALDLPLRALIREGEDGRVFVAFHPIVPHLISMGAPVELARPLQTAQHILFEAIVPENR